MTNPFGEKNNRDTADKPEQDVKNGNFLPPEMGMFIWKKESEDTRQKDASNHNGAESFLHNCLQK